MKNNVLFNCVYRPWVVTLKYNTYIHSIDCCFFFGMMVNIFASVFISFSGIWNFKYQIQWKRLYIINKDVFKTNISCICMVSEQYRVAETAQVASLYFNFVILHKCCCPTKCCHVYQQNDAACEQYTVVFLDKDTDIWMLNAGNHPHSILLTLHCSRLHHTCSLLCHLVAAILVFSAVCEILPLFLMTA